MSMTDLYDFPADHVGRKSYVGVRGHTKSVPKFKTYRGSDGYNYLLPEFGGTWDGLGNQAPMYMPDKAAYNSPMDRTVVEGRAAHREHMNRHDVYEAGDMTRTDFRPSEMPRAGDDIRRAMQELRSR